MRDVINWKDEEENLKRMINEEKLPYEEIGRKYGCTGSNIKKQSKKLGIKLEPRRSINSNEKFNTGKTLVPMLTCTECGKQYKKYCKSNKDFCSNKCRLSYNHKQVYQKFLKGGEEYMKGNYSPKSFKKDIIKEQGSKCAICGIEENWNGKPLVFILDHIDGKAANNKRDNLRCICPNCDSQLDTYKFKNKNSDRYYYRYGKNKEGENPNPSNP